MELHHLPTSLVVTVIIRQSLKRRTPLCTLVGAIPGAAPPLIGWAAARGTLNVEAWVLYGIVFLWQLPHFMAIAWMYREDYQRAGYVVLPKDPRRASLIVRRVLRVSLALVPVSVLPTVLGNAGDIYLIGALVLGLSLFYCALGLPFFKSRAAARRLVFASLLYLPALFTLMMLDTVVPK